MKDEKECDAGYAAAVAYGEKTALDDFYHTGGLFPRLAYSERKRSIRWHEFERRQQ